MKLIFETVALLLVIILVSTKHQAEAKNTACMCPRNLDPVCGTDGDTYSNPCLLRCEAETERGRTTGLKINYRGECGKKFIPIQTKAKNIACICPRNYEPVCGTDGKTYSNKCVLDCEAQTVHGKTIGLKVAHQGQCN